MTLHFGSQLYARGPKRGGENLEAPPRGRFFGIILLANLLAGAEVCDSRSDATAWSEPSLNYVYLRKAFETSGREWMQENAGVKWNEAKGKWEIDRQWSYEEQASQRSYYIEFTSRGAVNMGLACHDLRLLNELAEFHTVYTQRFTTLGEMRHRKKPSQTTYLLDNQGDDSARTLLWIDEDGRIRENVLYTGQFFHPAARLVRAITTLPESERTPSMKNFVRLYTPLIVGDHLLRFLYQAEWDYWGARDLPKHLVDIWTTIRSSSTRPEYSYQHSMQDWDLWLIAAAAEMLGANANDPTLVPLKPDEKTRLQRALRVGVSLLQEKRTTDPGTKNFRRETVGSAWYFSGDMDDHEEMAYSAYTAQSFPTEKQKRVHRGGTWDISHYYRVPVLLRSLYDNKKATGVDFPLVHDVELVTNQYMYRVFRGDLNRPLFNNFADGTNAWYQVRGANFGYPPAQYCDAHNPDRPCLTDGAAIAWGLLASFNPDLMELEHSLAKLAARDDPETERFKDRFYYYNNQSYSFRDERRHLQYPILLFWILSGVPEKLQGCRSQ